MTSIFSPPELLAAYTCGIDPVDDDGPLAAGTHVRVLAGSDSAFPLAPFVVLRTAAYSDTVDLVDVDPPADGITRTCAVSWSDGPYERTVGLRLEPEDGSVTATVLGPDRTELAYCDRWPYEVDPGRSTVVALRGAYDGTPVRRMRVDLDSLLGFRPEDVLTVIGMPTGEPRSAWYAAGVDDATGLDRAATGAPVRRSPMDDPGEGDWPGTDEAYRAEWERAEALLAGPGSPRELLARTVSDPEPPWLQVESLDVPGVQRGELPRLSALQLAALDPTIARWLGFGCRLDDVLLGTDGGHTPAVAVLGLLAVDPALRERAPHLADWLAGPTVVEDDLYELYLAGLAAHAGSYAADTVRDLRADLGSRGVDVRVCVAVSAPLRPWLPPRLPGPVLVDHRWQTPDTPEVSTRFRAGVAFPGTGEVTLAAVQRVVGDGWTEVRHTMLATPSGDRGAPRVFGRENDPLARVGAAPVPGTTTSAEAAAILAEQDVPSEDGDVVYGFRAADVFGRFGKATELPVPPPPRPLPPAPVLRHHLDLAPDVDQLPPTGPLSPGVLRVLITVPGIDELAAGSLPIDHVVIDGTAHPAAPGAVDHSIPLDPLPPQASTVRTVTVAFRSGVGTGATAAVRVPVRDRRLPPPLDVATGLVWTSNPGPAADVTVALTWRAAPGAGHRVYVTDQYGLTGSSGTPLFATTPAMSRADVADIGSAATGTDRKSFRLLPDLVTADRNGRAVLRTALPRSSRAVSFLRIVPLTADGAEAPFAACPLVPVAVPDDRRPPPPLLDGAVDPGTGGASLTVRTDGLDAAALRPGDAAPRFRIRRAVARPSGAALPHPVYARTIPGGEGPLVPDGSSVFHGTPTATPRLEPFVRYVFWAEVRMPPEHRLRPGAVALAPPGGVAALDPADAADRERPSSPPSAPRTLLHLPSGPPPPPAVEILEARDGGTGVLLVLTDPPRAHDAAIGPYRLVAWYGWRFQPIHPVADTDLGPLDEWVPDPGPIVLSTPVTGIPDGSGDPFGAMTVRLAYVDPAGRRGPLSSASPVSGPTRQR